LVLGLFLGISAWDGVKAQIVRPFELFVGLLELPMLDRLVIIPRPLRPHSDPRMVGFEPPHFILVHVDQLARFLFLFWVHGLLSVGPFYIYIRSLLLLY